MNRRPSLLLTLGLTWCLFGCEKPPQPSQPPAPALTPAAPPDRPAVAGSETPRSVEVPSGLTGPHWWCQQETYDFGEVWAGAVVKFPFTIKNVGTELLKILEAKAQCSCTASEDYTKEIAPGQSGTMPIRMLTTGKKGFVTEKMKIKTNDPTRPEITFEMKGMVKSLLDIELLSDADASRNPKPAEALAEMKKLGPTNFGAIRADQRLQRTVKLRNTGGRPLKLKLVGVMPRDSRFSAQLQESVPQEEFIVTINGDPPFPIGNTSASIIMETDVPGLPTFNLSTHAYVPPRVECRPTRIVVDPMIHYVPVRRLNINNNGETNWEIKGISVSDPAIKLELLPGPDPKRRVVQVTLPQPTYSVPEYGEVIRIETTDAEVPLIEVPIRASQDRPPAPRPADKPLTMHPVPLR